MEQDAGEPDAIGRLTRLCLALGIIPVFAPPREPGLQNAIEGFVLSVLAAWPELGVGGCSSCERMQPLRSRPYSHSLFIKSMARVIDDLYCFGLRVVLRHLLQGI